MFKNFKYFIQAFIVYLLFIIGRILGLRLCRKIFSYLFLRLAPSFKSKKIIEKNLDFFSKKKSQEEKEVIISNMWKNYGKTFIEYIFLDLFRKNNNHIKIHGENILKKIIEDDKPVIFVSGHFSNFELMSMEITKRKINLATIYRPLNNYYLNPFMEFLRKRYVCKNQIKKGINGVRDAIEYIKKNHSIALMIDQRVSEGEKIYFFNYPALTTTLPAQLAIKYKLKIVPVFIEREKDNTFKVEFFNQIDPNIYENKSNLTKKLNEFIEAMLIKNPNEWIWSHDRWKL
tara:strand:+ start:695 stop:1555 length:861 start_codon:yes stop_codon:yes gene_type:complete